MLENCGTAEKYYVAVRPQTNEIHSVHREGCPFMPDDGKRIYLGFFHPVMRRVLKEKNISIKVMDAGIAPKSLLTSKLN